MTDTRFPRPRPVIGDRTSAGERRADPAGWAMGPDVRDHLAAVLGARRDIRRYRPDPVPQELLLEVLRAGHSAPSVGHSQPWRFIVVDAPAVRDRAAHLADRARLAQARGMSPERAARLLDLRLEGIREAPLGIVVACDRRVPAGGVLGRASFPDTDLWSCACAIQNMWLTARALGLGMGWVTFFEPSELSALLELPDGVETLGWMCLGWPDERPPAPGLERAAWSRRLPLEDVVMHNAWDRGAPAPAGHLQGPGGAALVGSTDAADELLAPAESLGLLDRAMSRVAALLGPGVATGSLVLAGADHPVAGLGVSAYDAGVTRNVMEAAAAGRSQGAAAARAAGLQTVVVDAGVAGDPVAGAVLARAAGPRGDLRHTPALTDSDVATLLAAGRRIGRDAAATGIVALGEVGIGNTTVAAALTCAVLGIAPAEAVGLGAGADHAIVRTKLAVVDDALRRVGTGRTPLQLLAQLSGPEFVVLTGVTLGCAHAGVPVVLDGLATSVAALLAVRIEPAAQAYLVAGQRSREAAHGMVLDELGLEPLLQLRLRAGEGVGACLASSLLLQGLATRAGTVRTR